MRLEEFRQDLGQSDGILSQSDGGRSPEVLLQLAHRAIARRTHRQATVWLTVVLKGGLVKAHCYCQCEGSPCAAFNRDGGKKIDQLTAAQVTLVTGTDTRSKLKEVVRAVRALSALE